MTTADFACPVCGCQFSTVEFSSAGVTMHCQQCREEAAISKRAREARAQQYQDDFVSGLLDRQQDNA